MCGNSSGRAPIRHCLAFGAIAHNTRGRRIRVRKGVSEMVFGVGASLRNGQHLSTKEQCLVRLLSSHRHENVTHAHRSAIRGERLVGYLYVMSPGGDKSNPLNAAHCGSGVRSTVKMIRMTITFHMRLSNAHVTHTSHMPHICKHAESVNIGVRVHFFFRSRRNQIN